MSNKEAVDPEDPDEDVDDSMKEIESTEYGTFLWFFRCAHSARSVIRVVLQFLKENSLLNTFNALVQETNVHLNTIENPAALASAIKAGEWDAVMREVATVELSDSVQADLFEQITLELLELRELDAARKLLRTRPLRALQTYNAERYARLEGTVQRGEVTEWPSGSKKKNRKLLAKTVVADLSTVPPSRLLAVMGQALKWQRYMGMLPPGTSFSVFRNEVRSSVRMSASCSCLSCQGSRSSARRRASSDAGNDTNRLCQGLSAHLRLLLA